MAMRLSSQPDIAILSTSLDIPLAALEPYKQRRIIVITGEKADREAIDSLRDNNVEVLFAGPEKQVDGRTMISVLAGQKYQSIYSIAGPAVFHTLLVIFAERPDIARILVMIKYFFTISHLVFSGYLNSYFDEWDQAAVFLKPEPKSAAPDSSVADDVASSSVMLLR